MIRAFVECESPSDDPASVDRFVDLLAASTQGIARVKTYPGGKKYGKRHARFDSSCPGRKKDGPDSGVGPLGYRVAAGYASHHAFPAIPGAPVGAGCVRMKAGLVFFIVAMRALRDLDRPVAKRVILQVNSDEEIGSPSSRALTEAAARASRAVLVLEPSQGLGRQAENRAQRRGGLHVTVHGKAAHAGLDFTSGASAIVEISRQIQRVAGFTRLDRGVTVSPGVIHGGTRSNVIAAECTAEIDVRFPRAADGRYLERQFASLKPFDKRCTIQVTGGLNRPPLERSAGGRALFRKAHALAGELGITLEECAVGGGSDGNFTAALGVPTLDGLGAVGEGAHASNESIRIDRIADRIALLSKLVAAL